MMNRPPLLLFLLLICFSAAGQPGKILFRNGTMEPLPNIRQGYLDSFNASALRYQDRGFGVLQFHQLPGERIRAMLEQGGITLLDYIPHHAYTISFSGNISLEVLQQSGARAIFLLEPAWKMDSYLAQGIIPSWSVNIPGTLDAWISFPATFSAKDIINRLTGMGAEILSDDLVNYRVLIVRIAAGRQNEFAAQPFVDYLQAAPPKDQILNYNSRSASRASGLNASIANGGRGLNGEGVVIGVGDNSDIQNHIDFSGRLINRAAAPFTSHGQHVSGTAAGAGIIAEHYRGYASRATIVSQYFSRILINASVYVNDYGMVITNNSYGSIVECDYHGTYDLTSRVLDQMAISLPHLQNVFAAGNSGNSTCAPFPPGFQTVLGSYQSAKNVLTVGATTDSSLVSGFSSKGPVRDGRLKPEIAVQGQGMISTVPNNSYGTNQGTSMASPGAAGGLALLYQRYRQINGGSNPDNALMKAVLINGATDRGNPGPDFRYGFGAMNLLRSVEMIENSSYFSGSSTQGSSNTYIISVPANTASLKVLLYWNDPAAALVSSRALVNDLDLEVTTPSLSTVLPLVLNANSANVNNAAVTAVDSLNNIEQVVISSPAAGNYSLKVRGTAIAQNPSQPFYLVYDIIPVHLLLATPAGGQALVPGELTKISWDAYGFSSGTADLDFSADNGVTWSSIATGLDINRFNYSWTVPAVFTSEALVRITRQGSGESAVSEKFTIAGQPVVSLAPVQCEGYINLQWTTVAGVTDYEVMMLQDGEMVPVATTTSTSWVFSGLSPDSVYWVTVRPVVNGAAGRRANAVSRTPASGSCAGSISDNDLRADAIVSPVTGRLFTSSELSSPATVSFRIRNLDDAAISNYELKYSLNGGPWITEISGIPVAAGTAYTHSFATPADLSAPGEYNLVAVVKNLAGDPVAVNDTLRMTIRHLDNQPLDLSVAHLDDFESAVNSEYIRDITGLPGIDRYDFSRNTAFGRLRPFINTGIAFSGTKALTLDADRYVPGFNTGLLYGTYNLSAYNVAANDLRLDFRYLNHGQFSNTDNRVWIRGSDSDAWIEVYNLLANQEDVGIYKKTGSLEIGKILALNGQNFSSSFQVRWGQRGILPATEIDAAGGYTFDDIRVYEVFNDLQMLSVDSPSTASCGLGSATGILVTVRNSSSSVAVDIPVRYRVNGGSWVSEIIPSIPANTTQQYLFTSTADLSSFGSFQLQALVDYSADSFRENDTLTVTIRNTPVITGFPYLEDFENGDGYWYAGGKKSSWEYGTPASTRISGAASGARAWKTRLLGGYNDDELSYLYSPCFDITGMSNPTLSFSAAIDIEDCGTTLCDGAWVEYSADGITWSKLGTSGSGTNWYNKATDQLWSIQNYTHWHVATMALPAGIPRLRLRFVLASDAGVTREGFAIDDVHIYDNIHGIYNGSTMISPEVLPVSGSNWVHITSGGKLIASILPDGQDLGSTEAQCYISSTVRYNSQQYYHNRNIAIRPANRVTGDSVTVRFYFTDAETEALINAAGCSSCTKPASAYELGVSKYSDPDFAFENGTILDNVQGIWLFLNRQERRMVPFDIGYYAEFRVKDFSEFWLNNGGFDQNTPLPVKLLQFTAQKTANQDVWLRWDVSGQVDVDHYEVQLARSDAAMQSGNFEKIGEVAAVSGSGTLQYSFMDTEPAKTGTRYYRLRIMNSDGSYQYSPLRSVSFTEAVMWQVYPNPSHGLFFLVYQLNAGEKLQASVFDATGRLVSESGATGTGSPQKLVIELPKTLSAGIYLLRVQAAGRSHAFRLHHVPQ